MNIIFRVDASVEIGIGHVMRCVTLGKKLKEQGCYIRFVSRFLPEALYELLSNLFDVILLLNTDQTQLYWIREYSCWLGVNQLFDAKETLKVLEDKKWDWIIIDHYGIGISWHKEIRAAKARIMVVDDLADRLYDCDILLDQTFQRRYLEYNNLVNAPCKLLLGTDYALLRDEFSYNRTEILARRRQVSLDSLNILVMYGGTDPDNLTCPTVDALLELSMVSHVNIVLSSSAKHKKNVFSRYSKNSCVSIDVSPEKIAPLILQADLAIGAAGTTSWERCALALPSLVVVQAENQKLIAQQLEQYDVIKCIESLERKEDIKKGIEELCMSFSEYFERAAKCLNVCDAKGTSRVVNEMVISP